MSTQVQSVIFDESKYSVTEAKKWLRDNGFVAPKVDKTDRYLRFRQKQPSYFDESSFRTIPFGKGKGIKAIIGVPMKQNPFFDELDPDGDGHRIGAYAMLFTKAKNEWKRTGDPLELAKAKQYWDQYIDARDRYETVEDRRGEGESLLLHEMGSFDQAIQNPKQRNNPMKTRKRKAFVEEIRKLSDAEIMQYISATEDQINNEEAYLLSIEDDKAHGTGSFSELMSLERETEAEIDILKDQIRIMKDLLSVRKELCKNPMKTHKNPVIEGKTLVENIKGLQALVDKVLKSKTNYSLDDIQNAILDPLSKLNMYGIDAEAIRYYAFADGEAYVIILFRSSMGNVSLSIHQNKQRKISGKVNYIDEQIGGGVIGDGRHPVTGKKSLFDSIQGEFGRQKWYGTTRWPSDEKKEIKLDRAKFQRLSDLIAEKVVSLTDLKQYAYVVDGQENGLEELLTQKDMRMNPHCHCYGHKKNPHCPVHGRKKNPYGTAFRHGHMSGLAYRYNPTKKIMDFESFMDNLADGNVFVGRYVIFVQDGVPMRLEIGSSTPKEVSPEVAFYADLAGQAELVGTSDIDAFSDDYRGLIRQASDASSGGAVAGGGVPVVEVEEVIVPTPTPTPAPQVDPSLEALEDLESGFKFAQDGKITSDVMLERGLKYIKDDLKEALKVGKRHEKEVIARLQILADSKRAKKAETLTEKIIARYIKFAEKSIGAKIDIVDDETGEKITPKEEAEKIVEEAREEVVAPTPAPAPAPAPAQGGESDFMQMLREMKASDDAFKAQFKNNPRGSHYAYRMSTLDHDHRMDYVPLNNVYIKKNPTDKFRFPQTKVLGIDIDNDIYTWLSTSLSDYGKLITLAMADPRYAEAIPTLEALKQSNDEFIVRMQTEIVPAVEDKVKKQLASGKTLKEITGKAKKNPRRSRRNTSRRRRYY